MSVCHSSGCRLCANAIFDTNWWFSGSMFIYQRVNHVKPLCSLFWVSWNQTLRRTWSRTNAAPWLWRPRNSRQQTGDWPYFGSNKWSFLKKRVIPKSPWDSMLRYAFLWSNDWMMKMGYPHFTTPPNINFMEISWGSFKHGNWNCPINGGLNRKINYSKEV